MHVVGVNEVCTCRVCMKGGWCESGAQQPGEARAAVVGVKGVDVGRAWRGVNGGCEYRVCSCET